MQFEILPKAINDISGQGSKLVRYLTFKGAHTDEFFGIPATGKTVSIEGTTLDRMADGKIADKEISLTIWSSPGNLE